MRARAKEIKSSRARGFNIDFRLYESASKHAGARVQDHDQCAAPFHPRSQASIAPAPQRAELIEYIQPVDCLGTVAWTDDRRRWEDGRGIRWQEGASVLTSARSSSAGKIQSVGCGERSTRRLHISSGSRRLRLIKDRGAPDFSSSSSSRSARKLDDGCPLAAAQWQERGRRKEVRGSCITWNRKCLELITISVFFLLRVARIRLRHRGC
jgi:hypothetical protein